MRKNVFVKIILIATLVLGLSTNSFAADAKKPPEEKPVNSMLSAFQQGTVKGLFRYIYMNRYFDQNSLDRHTKAVGGHLHYETAPFAGFRLGIDFKTTQGAGSNSDDDGVYSPIYPRDTDGNIKNVNALDEYYLKYKGFNTTITAGAQALRTPAMIGHRLRIMEKKYLGLGVINKSIKNVEIQGYYIDQYMGWFDEKFNSVTSGITRNTDDDEGAFIAGVKWKAPKGVSLEAWDYYYPEVMNQIYTRGQYKHSLNNDLNMTVELRYFGMKDIGEALGGAIDTYDAGAIVGLKGYGFSLTGFYAKNGDDIVPDPFDAPLVILMQGNISNQAELNAYAIQLGYDFAQTVPGLSTYVMYGDFDTPDSGPNALADSTEIDFNVSYKFQGWAKGAAAKVRYAIVDNDEAVRNGEDYTDLRFYLDFNF